MFLCLLPVSCELSSKVNWCFLLRLSVRPEITAMVDWARKKNNSFLDLKDWNAVSYYRVLLVLSAMIKSASVSL